MKRDRLRRHGARLSEIIIGGFEALVLENRWLRVTLLPGKGSDIIEMIYKPLDVDLLWRAPAGFWTHDRPADFAGASFIDNYPGGWQEILPNGGPASTHNGAVFEEHGEVALLPWSWQVIADEPEHVSVLLTVRARRVPLYLEKRVTLRRDSATFFIEETVTNVGGESVDLMWGHHPAFGAPFIDESCIIDVPARAAISHPVERFPSQRLDPDQAFVWSLAQGHSGERVDFSHPQPQKAGTADLIYLTDLNAGWFAITNPRLSLRVGMAWTRETLPYLWYWHDANGTHGYPWYGDSYVLALEPWSSYPSMGLAHTVEQGTHLTLQPGEQRQAQLTTVIDTGIERVRSVSIAGIIQ